MADRRKGLLKRAAEAMTEKARLEILLENAFPDENCALLAERIAACFPSLYSVLTARPEELYAVEGMPACVADYLVCVGRCRRGKTFMSADAPKRIADRKTFGAFALNRLKDMDSECAIIVLVNRSGKVLSCGTFSSSSIQFVKMRPGKILELMSGINFSGAYLAHNHVNVPAAPSAQDNEFTAAMTEMTRKCSARLIDHVIVNNGGECFSYADSGRLAEIAALVNDRRTVDGD